MTADEASPESRNVNLLHRVSPWAGGQAAGLSPARSELWLPGPALASCVRGVMIRDTRGVELTGAERLNHFPASPTCAVVWYLSGECEFPSAPLESSRASDFDAWQGHERLPAIGFFGPTSEPMFSWNPGPMHALLLLLPDAMAQLTGIDPGAYVDRFVPAAAVFDTDWLAWCDEVMHAADDSQRLAAIERFLAARWKIARSGGIGSWLTDWVHSLGLRASLAGSGRSPRQAERRIKAWSGHTLRELRLMERAERGFLDGARAYRSGRLNLSRIAAETGYADQSHFSRVTRRFTGFAPGELVQRVAREEAFWAYRLWGFGADMRNG